MTCKTCDSAQADPKAKAAYMEAGCFGCQARAIAITALHSESARTRRMTPEYRKVLQALFENDWQAGHEEVKRWSSIMKGSA